MTKSIYQLLKAGFFILLCSQAAIAASLTMLSSSTFSPMSVSEYASVTFDPVSNCAIAVGNAKLSTTNYDWLIVKYSTDGVKLSSTTYAHSGGKIDKATCVAYDEGTYLVGGFVSNGSNNDTYIIRYSTSFTNLGSAIFNSGGSDTLFAMYVNSDRKIYACGTAGNDSFLIKYSSSLVMLSSSVVNFISGWDEARAITSDGSNIYTCGSGNDGSQVDGYVAKYDANCVFVSSCIGIPKTSNGDSFADIIYDAASSKLHVIASLSAESYSPDIVLSQYNTSMVFQSSTTVLPRSTIGVYAVTKALVDLNGQICWCGSAPQDGSSDKDALIQQVDKTTYTETTLTKYALTTSEAFQGIAKDSSNNLALVGYTSSWGASLFMYVSNPYTGGGGAPAVSTFTPFVTMFNNNH